MFFDRPDAGGRAVVVHIEIARAAQPSAEAPLDEACELVTSAGLEVAARLAGTRREPHPRWYLGQGKVDELCDLLADHEANLVIVNHDLGAGQLRNLEAAVGCRVITRTELILLIFADRARTFEGKLQVELAQLRHAQTRVTRGWSHLDRQKGGVGLRGAGETQREMDLRLLSARIKKLETRLEEVRHRRGLNRRRRARRKVATVALVGYTNAGKSTLFNTLTEADVLAEQRMFATLDPTLRGWPLPGPGEVVLADTVGFIRDLPVALVEAFRATLEEVAEADLLLVVVDAADPTRGMQLSEVTRTLKELGADQVPAVLVWNKVDQLAPGDRAGLPLEFQAPEHAFVATCEISAHKGTGLDELRDAASWQLGAAHQDLHVLLSPAEGKMRAWLYAQGAVVTEEIRENGSFALLVRAEPALAAKLQTRLQQSPSVVVSQGV